MNATTPRPDGPEAEARPCVVCGSQAIRRLRHSSAWGFDIGRCDVCGMVSVTNPPPPEAVEAVYAEDGDYAFYTDHERGDSPIRGQILGRLFSMVEPADGAAPMLFDVGAGAGDFVVQAREHGFAVSGNEISPLAIDFARDRNSIELSPLALADQPPESVDAITLWCVIAHVPEPLALLADAFAMLRPGGVLFLRTPRWCTFDVVGDGLARITRGRMSSLADRRMNVAHMHMFSAQNLARGLSSLGFTDLAIEPACHYAFRTDAYVDSAGVPRGIGRGVTMVADPLIERGWFVRNVLFAFARKPRA